MKCVGVEQYMGGSPLRTGVLPKCKINEIEGPIVPKDNALLAHAPARTLVACFT